MANIRSFKELRVWQNAMDAAMHVFDLTKRFPVEERHSLTDQFRRASRSVAANISEGWRKRRYPAAFVSKLNDAESEAAETQSWMLIAQRCRYLDEPFILAMDDRYEHIMSQIALMIDNASSWLII